MKSETLEIRSTVFLFCRNIIIALLPFAGSCVLLWNYKHSTPGVIITTSWCATSQSHMSTAGHSVHGPTTKFLQLPSYRFWYHSCRLLLPVRNMSLQIRLSYNFLDYGVIYIGHRAYGTQAGHKSPVNQFPDRADIVVRLLCGRTIYM